MSTKQSIEEFLKQSPIAVVGISRDNKKFGNLAFRELKKRGFNLIPVHSEINEFEGATCIGEIGELPSSVNALFISAKPDKAVVAIRQAAAHGIRHIWIQQGSMAPELSKTIEESGLDVITGKCILMFAPPVNSIHGFHRFIMKAFGKLPK